MEPANTIINRFATPERSGVERVAEILGLSVTSVYYFTYPKHKRGTGGLIPAKHQQRLLDYARDHDIDLSPDDFFVNAA